MTKEGYVEKMKVPELHHKNEVRHGYNPSVDIEDLD